MKDILERSRYILLIAVGALLLASATLLVWGAYTTLDAVWGLINGGGKPTITITFIQLIDTLLVATILYVFAVALYELFIGDLELPGWLVIHNLDELKSKLIGVIVLVIVVAFAEHFVSWDDSQKLWLNALSAAVVIGVLALFNRFGANHN
jgi:uncharacterized membrane protein YqhA